MKNDRSTGFYTDGDRFGGNTFNDHDDYRSKLLIGSVIGVSMAVVLIIILVKVCYETIVKPPCRKGTVQCICEIFTMFTPEDLSWRTRTGLYLHAFRIKIMMGSITRECFDAF